MTRPVEQLPAPPRVSLAIEPDAERTFEFFRDLIAEAEAWDRERKKDREAA